MNNIKTINKKGGCVDIDSIHELIAKYEDKIRCVENLKNRGGSTWGSESPTKADRERLDVRIYERKTFIEDLKSILDKQI